MALITTEILNQEDHGHQVRLVFRMTFTGNEQITLNRRCRDLSEIPTIQAIAEASATELIKTRAASKAFSAGGDIAANGEATANEVAKYYLSRALHEPDLIAAFKVFRRIRTYVQARDYTWSQVRSFSGLREKDWNVLKNRLDYFTSNSTAITNFISVAENDPGAQ